jgi:hypothetical protein
LSLRLTTEKVVETTVMIGFGAVLLTWLYGLSALLFRRPRAG